MSQPTVSVVIPCYNQGRFISEALASVVAQTTPAAEVIVVDDGSTDDTRDVVRGFPGVTYAWQRNRGLAHARNKGCHLSRGEFVVFLDSDDRLRADALAIGLRALAASPEAAFSFGRCVRIDETGAPLPTVHPPLITGDVYAVLLTRNVIWTPAVVMFRRARCGRELWFNPDFDAAADYDLYLRLTRHLPTAGHPHVVAEYRLHSASMSGDAALMLTTTLEVLRRHRRHVPMAMSGLHQAALRTWSHYYGEQLVEQIGRRVRTGAPWTLVARDLFTLARHYPAGLARHLGRKARRRAQTSEWADGPESGAAEQESDAPGGGAASTAVAGLRSGPAVTDDRRESEQQAAGQRKRAGFRPRRDEGPFRSRHGLPDKGSVSDHDGAALEAEGGHERHGGDEGEHGENERYEASAHERFPDDGFTKCGARPVGRVPCA